MGDLARKFNAKRINFTTGEIKMIVDKMVLKNSIIIKNLGPGEIWIDGDESNIVTDGYPLCSGEWLSIGLQERSPQDPSYQMIEVWAYCPNEDTQIAMLNEVI